jgi:hypothetical protein
VTYYRNRPNPHFSVAVRTLVSRIYRACWGEQKGDDVATEKLARRCGVTPIRSTEDLYALAQPELWNSEADYNAFLAGLYATRHGCRLTGAGARLLSFS